MSARTTNRRKFLGDSAVALAAAACSSSLAGGAPARPKRNVILIISDTLRRDAVGCYGGGWVSTPNLDGFAKSGVRCNNAYLSSFPTVPARNDILTGRPTFTYKPWSPLDSNAVTLADVLRPAGVYTALIADTPHPFRPAYNYQRNFDFVRINHGQENDDGPKQPAKVALPCDPRKLRGGSAVMSQYLRNVANRRGEQDYFPAQTMRAAADWLESNHRRQPFFLYLDTFDPHEPWDPPQSYVNRYDPGYHGEEVIYPRYDRWREFLSEAELRHCRALYAGEVSLVDAWIGHLLRKVERLGLLESTLLLIMADHGIYLGEHGYIGKALIRGDRFQNLPLYPEVCRIPMLARFPGCRPGSEVAGLTQTLGIGPTVLDFLGVRQPPSFLARSLWPLLRGDESSLTGVVIGSPTLSHRSLSRPQPHARATITDGRWLLIFGAGGGGDAGEVTASVDSKCRHAGSIAGENTSPELYDLQADPECAKNLIRAHREKASELHRSFVAFLEQSPMRREHLSFFNRL